MAERYAFARSFQVGGRTCTVVVEFSRFGTGQRWMTKWEPEPPCRLTEKELLQYQAEHARISKENARLLEIDRYG